MAKAGKFFFLFQDNAIYCLKSRSYFTYCSWLFVILTDKKTHSNSNFNNKKSIAKQVGISEGQNYWIAVNSSLNLSSINQSNEIDFGTQLLENLNAGTTYEINILVENQYKNISRYAVLKLEVTTLEGYNYMLLLLLLLIPIMCIIVFL